ncbi:MAG: aminodeoxychorismate synthase component I, partial [Verrucomicrobia bacterium]|nr:aminodeoxychorismate synthase component I [Verrucomicrobiota bacterium]
HHPVTPSPHHPITLQSPAREIRFPSGMPSSGPFVSLNSWVAPGWIYQAEEPFRIVQGGPGDWAELAGALDECRRERADASPHPRGAAVGYFGYEGEFWFAFFEQLRAVPSGQPTEAWSRRRAAGPVGAEVGPWESGMTRAQFEAGVRAAQEAIAAGQVYQVNLTQQFRCAFRGCDYALFEQLAAHSPAPGSAFLDTGARAILSASPELFLRLDGREITTKPIKGTRPRDRDPMRDARLEYELRTDPKEIAELVMITDLERNDLGQICEYGSVTVPGLLQLEKFPQVQHLVSTVRGHLRPEVTPLQALAACFPGGSITGAPKKTARELIARLEPVPRGVYCGAIGYFGFDGDMAFNIAIRTLVHERERHELHYHVGAGLTAGSDPAREFEETMHKGRGLRQAVDALAAAGRSAVKARVGP